MIDKKALEYVKECIDQNHKFVLTTHVNPDGDGLGSEAALAAFLEDLGKEVFVYNNSRTPPNYDFLDPDHRIVVYDTGMHREILLQADCIFILDISEWTRLRQVGKDIRDRDVKKVFIDHHPTEEIDPSTSLINVKACATGEIVYDLIKFCNGRITKRIATGLYTSIITDTGSFRFSNTNIKAFKISAELLESGISPAQIYQTIYERQSYSKVKLFGNLLTKLRLDVGGKIAWFTIPQHLVESTAAKPYDTEGFVDYPLSIKGVEISLMFFENEQGKIKVSLRSKGNYVINGIAQKFGGGGHPFAAGVLLEGNLNELTERMLEEVTYLFKE